MDESNLSLSDYYSAIKAEHEANNAWSAEQAAKAQEYQTQMSNTAHQREVADLKAAGLNPVLSAGGQGATTGAGISAQRDDSNVTALYGLMKEAFKANMEQAKAMQNTAKYISGSAGSSNPIEAGLGHTKGYLTEKTEKKEKRKTDEELYKEVSENNPLLSLEKHSNAIAAGLASRIFGGSQQKWEETFNYLTEGKSKAVFKVAKALVKGNSASKIAKAVLAPGSAIVGSLFKKKK